MTEETMWIASAILILIYIDTMLDLWRSEEMQRVRLLIPAEATHATITALGHTSAIQFVDLNKSKSAFQRTFATEVKRCEEMARKLRFFRDQVEGAGLMISGRGAVNEFTLEELEIHLEEMEHELLEVNANSDRLHRTEAELIELQLVLEHAGSFFEDAHRMSSTTASESVAFETPLLECSIEVESKVGRLGFVAGMIETSKVYQYERTLFRATRGNVFLKNVNVGRVRDPATGNMAEKDVFVAFFSGERIRNKIIKISEVFNANRYPFPEENSRQHAMHRDVCIRLRELKTTIDAGENLRSSVLQALSINCDDWMTRVMQEKASFHVMNRLSVDNSRKILVGEGWMPSKRVEEIKDILRMACLETNSQTHTIMEFVRPDKKPPTHYNTNKFTSGFQSIVESYGVARYREVNPTLFTIVTFPFLFAVMFGDMGHGLLMLMFALFLIIREKSLSKQRLGDMLGMLFGGRYVICLMALFSIYVGIIYNEAFSIPLTLFGDTSWGCTDKPDDHRGCPSKATMILNHVYAFGLDPIWHGTKTELTFTNSIKMKMSIILGVMHMDLGIMMSVFNHLYFKDSLSVWCEFVPQMIFLNSLFGYLCFLIIHKWAIRTEADLYTLLIDMFLRPGRIDSSAKLYTGQSGLQIVLALGALVSVPWMLLPKPYILRARHNKRRLAGMKYDRVSDHESDHEQCGEEDLSLTDTPDEHGGHFSFEFVSNTASYLRLWALTLAHSQLSAVFYDKVMMHGAALASKYGLTTLTLAANVIAFFVFEMATLGVLMVMESLSAFLHALRLHWVEYQTKFYYGDGYKFDPFTFSSLSKTDL